MLSPAEAAAEVTRRDDAAAGLLPFTVYTHPSWQSSAHHRLICGALEAVERGEITRLMIFAPPRHSKSELASRRFPSWYLGRHPSDQIICASYGDLLASDIGADVRDILRDPTYQNVFPGVDLRADTSAAGRWRTNQGGIYVAAGVGGPIVGRGAHLAIIDDPIKGREEADSARMREIAWRWYWGNLITRLMPGGRVVLMMTRWAEDDLAGRLLDVEGDRWTVLELQAIQDEGSDHERALWPAWFPLEKMHEIRAGYLRAGRAREWNAQYQQRPTAEQGAYMRREWFSERWADNPEPVRVYMASDFALTEPQEGADPDFTEHGVFGVGPDDAIYALDWWSGQTTPDLWCDALLDLVAKWRPLAWFGEGGVIRRAVEPFLVKRCRERRVYFRQEWVNPIHDKAVRGRPFQGRAAMGKFRLPGASEWAGRLVEQCVGFPGAGHDDAFDVCSLMCLVVDQAHPAVIVEKKPERPRDRYVQVTRREVAGWRVA